MLCTNVCCEIQQNTTFTLLKLAALKKNPMAFFVHLGSLNEYILSIWKYFGHFLKKEHLTDGIFKTNCFIMNWQNVILNKLYETQLS